MRVLFLLIYILFFFHEVFSQTILKARVSRINPTKQLVRLRFESLNSKFLQTNDDLEVWNELTSSLKCQAAVIGKSSEYYLMRIYQWEKCFSRSGFTVGSLLFLSSKNLEKTLVNAREMRRILLLKRALTSSKIDQVKNGNENNLSNIEYINNKYETMIQKIKEDWNNSLKSANEIASNEEKLLNSYRNSINEIDFELERYKIEDENTKLDRWALDQTINKNKL